MIVDGVINDRWSLKMPDFREEFHRLRPNWEAGRLAHMVDHIAPGMTVYDVGAEQGDFTALYKSWVGKDGFVVAVEPSPPMWPTIRATWWANSETFGHDWGVPGTFVGFASNETTLYGEGGYREDHWPDETDGPVVADPGFMHLTRDYVTDRIRLDDIAVEGAGAPDAVVIDVEGAEYEVLEGLGELRPMVYVSVHDIGDGAVWPGALKGWYGHMAEDLDELMVSRGYNPHVQLPTHGEGERFWFYELGGITDEQLQSLAAGAMAPA